MTGVLIGVVRRVDGCRSYLRDAALAGVLAGLMYAKVEIGTVRGDTRRIVGVSLDDGEIVTDEPLRVGDSVWFVRGME